MTDYINKLYELVGVQKGFIAYKCCDEDSYSGMPIYSGDKKFFTSYEQAEKENYIIPHYVKDDEEYYFNYPEFTADKQLKLFKLLIRKSQLSLFTHFHYKEKETYIELESEKFYKIIEANSFEECLVQIVMDVIDAGLIKIENVKKLLEQ